MAECYTSLELMQQANCLLHDAVCIAWVPQINTFAYFPNSKTIGVISAVLPLVRRNWCV
jgi:hypothetical protein